jgi:hypothetical protein
LHPPSTPPSTPINLQSDNAVSALGQKQKHDKDQMVNIQPVPGGGRRYTAQEKGKGKAHPATSPTTSRDLPSQTLLTSTVEDPLLHASTVTSPSTLSTSPIHDTHSLIPIPYGHPDIVTSRILNSINCVLYVPLRILICIVCQIAVNPKSIRNHRRTQHSVPASITTANLIDDLIDEHNVLEGDVLFGVISTIPAVPGIPWTDGWVCPMERCTHSRQSKAKMASHICKDHGLSGKSYLPIPSKVQAIFESNRTYYPIELPEAVPCVEPQPDPTEFALSMYRNATRQISSAVLKDDAHLTPFLAKYKWGDIIAETSPININSWVRGPNDQETWLLGLTPLVFEYYREIIKDMSTGQNWTTVLRYVNTSKG